MLMVMICRLLLVKSEQAVKPTNPRKKKTSMKAARKADFLLEQRGSRLSWEPEYALVHNDLRYKLRMVANDSTIKMSWPRLMDIRNSSSMLMETWLLSLRAAWSHYLALNKVHVTDVLQRNEELYADQLSCMLMYCREMKSKDEA
ncbi:hypothetical protein Tco_0921352 [Tanacetum coccineum]